jgi:hypothetical protein
MLLRVILLCELARYTVCFISGTIYTKLDQLHGNDEKLEKKRKVRRKSFAAREDLLDEMNKVARQGDLSLYRFLNQIFELTLRANEMGVTFSNLLDSRELLKDAMEGGFTLGLESLWYEMAEIAYAKAKNKTLSAWFDAGVWFAKRYVTGETDEPFEVFKKDLKDFTWNVPELDVDNKSDTVSVRIVSPRFTEAYTFLFLSFLEGALDAFGYKVDSKEVSRGLIRLEAVKN